MNTTDNAADIIQRLGGTTKTAVLCEVSAQAVSQWIHNGIPKTQLKFLRLARPDAFPAEPPIKRRRADKVK